MREGVFCQRKTYVRLGPALACQVRTPPELEACAYDYAATSAWVTPHAPMPALPLPVSSVSTAVEGAIPIERHQVSLHERKVGCPSELSNTTLRYCVNKGSCDDVQCKPSVSPSLCPTPLQRRIPPSLANAGASSGSGSGTGSGQPSELQVSRRLIL